MGLFSKERTGTVYTIVPGRVFAWEIPTIMLYADGVQHTLDSEIVPSYEKIDFHFHFVVGVAGDIGFYVHYKRAPIPKYTYFLQFGSVLETEAPVLRGHSPSKRDAIQASSDSDRSPSYPVPSSSSAPSFQKKPTRMRQHTAHTIPQDTERVGHWNICSMNDIGGMLFGHEARSGGSGVYGAPASSSSAVDGTDPFNWKTVKKSEASLWIYFSFDADTVIGSALNEDLKVVWTVPNIRRRNISPFSSKGFVFNGITYVLRVDTKVKPPMDDDEEPEEQLLFFLFCRKGAEKIPPYSMVVQADDHTVLATLERSDGSAILKCPTKLLHGCGDGALHVTVMLFNKGSNPLEQLNAAASSPTSDGKPSPMRTVQVPSSSNKEKLTAYAVVNDDDV